MTKSELIDAVAERMKITKTRAELAVNGVFEAMAAALERGEGIEIRGFGTFTVRQYKPYSGRNPRTGRTVAVPEKRLPFFKVGKELKELVNRTPVSDGAGGAAAGDEDDDDDTDQLDADEDEADDEAP
ncbi:MAG: integration host factor subunit beta [Myxococcota bacterium]|nr:integration host factor subunit beta [Myxococcota bacterium]MDW8362306.1 HU family DNA-binding protein [Myxococcales bacterium]